MRSDRDITRIVRSWLDEGATVLPDRVLDAVLDQLPTTPQRRAWWPAWRFLDMTNVARLAIAAAAVVVIAFIGIRMLPGTGGVGGPGQSPSPSPTLSPSPTPTSDSGLLEPGTYEATPFGGSVTISYTVPEGWTGESGILAKGSVGIVFSTVGNVYSDPCARTKLEPPLGPSVDDLVTALSSMPATTATTPTDVRLDEFDGRYFELTFGPDLGCAPEQYYMWDVEGGGGSRWAQGSGWRDRYWILDVDGSRILINAFSPPGASPAEVAEAIAVVESIQITPAPSN